MGEEEEQLTLGIRVSAGARCCAPCGPPLLSLSGSRQWDVGVHLREPRRAFMPELAGVWMQAGPEHLWARVAVSAIAGPLQAALPPAFLPGDVKAPPDE